jgi:hypothetical protein
MTGAEAIALENLRRSKDPLSRAMALIVADRDFPAGHAALIEHVERQTRYLAQSQLPGHGGWSPCGFAELGAERVLAAPPAQRRLDELAIAFEPALSATRWKGCNPRNVRAALATLAWLSNDEPRAAHHVARCNPDGIVDEITKAVISLLLRGRASEVPAAFSALAPRYVEAMAQGLWRTDPNAFLPVTLLASLLVGVERGLLELTALPDVLPYAPLGFLAYLRADPV